MIVRPKRIIGISLFSGGDLLGKGFENAGGKIGWAIELNPDFSAFHSENFLHPDGTPVVEVMDVRDFIKLGRKKILDKLKHYYGDYDFELVVLGGPPCVDLSPINNNKKTGLDSNSKTWLTLDFLRVVDMLQPVAAIMEEVPQFISDEHFFPLFMKDCQKLNYNVKLKKMCALSYEGNSIRNRAIFGFVRDDLKRMHAFPQKIPSGIKMSGDFLVLDYYWSGHFDDRPRFSWEPMTTVTSSSPQAFYKDGIMRIPTIQEIMLCQSLDPATYRLPQKYAYSTARKVFGNGVPTRMSYHIFRTLFTEVLGLEMTEGGLWLPKR